MQHVLVITDNELLLQRFRSLLERKQPVNVRFNFAYSPNNKYFAEQYAGANWIAPVKVKAEYEQLIAAYDMIISLHCKQLFPAELVNAIRCINVHPGLNPYNRGWFPQVFSIINGKPAGATIHEIDEELDHGAVIAQKEVKIEQHDTSLSAYNKVLEAELELLDAHLEAILMGSYETKKLPEGNLNLKKDFDDLCELDLDNTDKLKNHLNLLRALTHGSYMNGYFFDSDGKKVFVKLELFPEQN